MHMHAHASRGEDLPAAHVSERPLHAVSFISETTPLPCMRPDLLNWDAQYLPRWQPMRMSALLNETLALPLTFSSRPTKPTLLAPTPAQQQQARERGLRAAAPERFASLHAEFSAAGLLAGTLPPWDGVAGRPLLIYGSGAAAAAAAAAAAGADGAAVADAEAEGSGASAAALLERRLVTLDMLNPTRFQLVLTDPRALDPAAEATVVDLGQYAFVRVREITAREWNAQTSLEVWAFWGAGWASQETHVLCLLLLIGHLY
jgi:hypothetical protein